MKPRYVALLFLFVAVSLYLQLAADQNFGSSYSARGDGTRAIYLLLQERGHPVSLWLRAFSSLDKAEDKATMVIVDPSKTIGATKELLEWVERGNRLVVLGTWGPTVRPILAALGLPEVLPKVGPAEGRFTALISHLADTVEDEGIETNCEENYPDICKDVRRISALLPIAEDKKPNDFHSVVSKNRDSFVVEKKHGKGDIWLFSTSSPVLNNYIDKHDNHKLLFQLLTQGGTVYFDEFHHGFTAPVSAKHQSRYASLWTLIAYLTFAITIFALTRAVRFGPPHPSITTPPPGTADFAAVLGLLYYEHGTSSTLFRYVSSWKTRVGKKFGLSDRLPHRAFVDELGKRGVIAAQNRASVAHAIELLSNGKLQSEKQATSALEVLESVYSSHEQRDVSNILR